MLLYIKRFPFAQWYGGILSLIIYKVNCVNLVKSYIIRNVCQPSQYAELPGMSVHRTLRCFK